MWKVLASPDGERIVSTDDETLKIWNAATGALIDTIRVDGGALCIAMRDDQIFVGCLNGTVCTYTYTPKAK